MKAANPLPRPVIRQAQDADIDDLRQLRKQFFQTQLDAGLLDVPADLDQMLAISTPAIARGRRQLCFVVEADGVLAGYVVALLRMVPGLARKAVGSIEELYLALSLRGTGAAGNLVGEAVAALRGEGAERIQTRVLAANHAARAFWRRAGFAENVHILELGAEACAG